ncbi:hypothetical protein L6164_013429 [Bauhinia variegata]|uniref:Uncharacterized protein n=1 Tax=Bauhinia variegata TaxID=167791 RepID=A0ACB9NEX7_BAUVA|nr:hypothetical protein L6164_013429 [Bauhinia variegata]
MNPASDTNEKKWSDRVDILVGNDYEAINDMKMLERFGKAVIWLPTMKQAMLMLEGITQVPRPQSPTPF